MAVIVCKSCFYRYRGLDCDIASRCTHRAEKIDVKWNETEEFYETTHVRVPPRDLIHRVRGNVRLCDPQRGTCQGDNCTYAHGAAEQRKWNSILWKERKGGTRPISKCVCRCNLLLVLSIYCVVIM